MEDNTDILKLLVQHENCIVEVAETQELLKTIIINLQEEVKKLSITLNTYEEEICEYQQQKVRDIVKRK